MARLLVAWVVLAGCSSNGRAPDSLVQSDLSSARDLAGAAPIDLSTPVYPTCDGADLGSASSDCPFCPASCGNGLCGSCSIPLGYHCHYPAGVVCSCVAGTWSCSSA